MDFYEFWQAMLKEIATAPANEQRRIVTFHDPRQYAGALSQWKSLKPSRPGLRKVKVSPLIRAFVVPAAGAAKLMHKYAGALTIEEDLRIQIHSPAASSTTRRTSHYLPWGVKAIRAPQAWSRSTGVHIKIGVIDTGADFLHPDLKASLASGVNLLHRGILPLDDNGHGTHIAGTLAAAGGTRGMMGVAPRSLIYPVKAFDHTGSAYVSDIVLGIDWCVQNRIDLINMSFGMKTRSKALHDVVIKAYRAGIPIIASSGNDGKRGGDYPARYSETIAVGAIDNKRRVASFSNRGSYIDVYGPGENVPSCWPKEGYREMSGTSMATSHVTGAAALLLALCPGLTPRQLKLLLRRTSSPLRLRKGQRRAALGGGAVDAVRLLRARTRVRREAAGTGPASTG
ncbi:Subtilase family protein [Paenibacillus sophorae]|uniref:S8 family peptidase n=1 Tax=Paenibacillus sophorae TaxID=1333845 RepID=A0A1H8VY95_9BACL|nr:S8 family peptidase [Paenibacillus sophorae]QWU18151.1 S8 family peptidase [Paenibacillus sophorae]SEP20310.1 Subtilase family protein [Paenibacillus sophorae]